MNDRLIIFVKRMVDVLFAAGLIIEAMMPVILPELLERYTGTHTGILTGNLPETMQVYLPKLILVMGAGLFALLILWELRKMMKTVLADDCFVEANVTSLQKMGNFAFIIAVLMFCTNLLMITITAVTVTLVFLVAGLFSKVLASVFDRAVHYKLENDLTI